jgi:hypothetical protein
VVFVEYAFMVGRCKVKLRHWAWAGQNPAKPCWAANGLDQGKEKARPGKDGPCQNRPVLMFLSHRIICKRTDDNYSPSLRSISGY